MTIQLKKQKIRKVNKKIERLAIFNLISTMFFLILPINMYAYSPYVIHMDFYSPEEQVYQVYLPIEEGLYLPLEESHILNFSDTIRIGLESRYNLAQAVSFANTTLMFGTYNGNFQSLATIHGNNFRVAVDNGYYLTTDTFFHTFEEASYWSQNAMYNSNTVVSLINNNFTVLVGPFSYRPGAVAHDLLHPSTNRVTLFDGYNRLITTDFPMQFMDPTDFMNLGGRQYRGIIETGRHTGSGITPVNIINIEEYLKSVVPSEMPASWHVEALKAQTIAARSFTVVRRGSHNRLGYELCDTVFSQVYSGVGTEHQRSTEAVLATAGLLAWHGDRVILATYFSSSGGVTEDSQYVWLESVPYLRSIPDNFEEGGMVWNRSFTLTQINNFARNSNIHIGHIGSISLYHAPNGRVRRLTLHGSNSNHHIEREAIRTFFSSSENGSLQSRNFVMVDGRYGGTTTVNNPIGSLPAPVEQLDQVPTYLQYNTFQNHVTNIFLNQTNGQTTHVPVYFATIDPYGNSIRSTSYLSMQGFDFNNIQPISWELTQYTSILIPAPVPYVPAPVEEIKETKETQETIITITHSNGYTVHFSGRGWGHGVGMSQFGANSMANLGFDHVAILQHYYTGVQIR